MQSESSGGSRPGREDPVEFVGPDDFQLIVAAVLRQTVRSPVQELRGMAEPIALHVIVLNLADPLHPQGLPGQILAAAPAPLYSRHAASFPSYTHPITP